MTQQEERTTNTSIKYKNLRAAGGSDFCDFITSVHAFHTAYSFFRGGLFLSILAIFDSHFPHHF